MYKVEKCRANATMLIKNPCIRLLTIVVVFNTVVVLFVEASPVTGVLANMTEVSLHRRSSHETINELQFLNEKGFCAKNRYVYASCHYSFTSDGVNCGLYWW